MTVCAAGAQWCKAPKAELNSMHICTVCHVPVHGVNCGQCNNWDNNIKDSITCDGCYNKYKCAFTVIDAFKMLKKDPWPGLGMISE